MNAIETHGLSFSYGKNQVLDKISLCVPNGVIYGLLGRNGAGKTTMLKLLLNLLPSPKGTILFWGANDYDHNIFFKIGSMIESPALYDYMTVEEHLKMFNFIFKLSTERIDEIAEIVGLTNERSKKASKLSTGLKQRLAIAIALFRNPDLLILDEPINGLDPMGIIEVRDLLFKLQKEGKTILLSSHIFSEIEKLCSHIGILEQGELKYQGEMPLLHNQSLEHFYLSTLINK